MELKTLAAASWLTMAMATSTFAAPITLDFEFDGVSGTFYGLDDADGTSTATSYDYSSGQFSWTNVSSAGASSNVFEFGSGSLIAVDFLQALNSPADSAVGPYTDRLTELELNTINGESIEFRDAFQFDRQRSGTVTYTINPVAAVPLPAGGLLLLSGIGGVAALKRRKKRAA